MAPQQRGVAATKSSSFSSSSSILALNRGKGCYTQGQDCFEDEGEKILAKTK